MVELLTQLREEYSLCGIKTEFELEGARMEELSRLKEITLRAGVGITLKIGGCEAATGMKMARVIGVERIVAPMIESAFALKKFVRCAKNIFPEDELADIKLLVNIETITGFNNFQDMLDSPDFESLAGIANGRGDMSGSMGHGYEFMDSDEILEISNSLFTRVKQKGAEYECILGGIPGPKSFPFLSRIKPGTMDEYESRKLIFRSSGVFGEKEREGFLKGLQFELMWSLNKREHYARISAEEDRMINNLQKLLS